jgi:hypothetical protein
MKSRPAEAVRRSRHEDAEPMTAEQRLAEFLSHRQVMAQLANSEVAGQWVSARRGGSVVQWRHGPGQPGQCTGCRKDMTIELTDA